MIVERALETVRDALPWHAIVFPLMMLFLFFTGSTANGLLLAVVGYLIGMFGMAFFLAWFVYRD